MALGDISGASSYTLEAVAPDDTWFPEAYVCHDSSSARADTSPLMRLVYTADGGVEKPARLVATIHARATGVIRAGVFAAWLVVFTCVFGLVRSLSQPGHVLAPEPGTASAIGILLLFPGIAAVITSKPAPHTLTATLQFPTRLSLWALATTCYFLAVATAIGVSGISCLAVWAAATAFAAVSTGVLTVRAAVLRHQLRRVSLAPSDSLGRG